MKVRMPALLVVASLTAGGLATASAKARADFHFMQVQEVSAGTTTQPNADFIELQMTARGQGNVSGHKLLLYDAAGTRLDCTLPADVGSESLGDPILLGTAEFQALVSPDPDFTVPPLLHSDGGAVCWENIDCVSWGSFSGSTTSPAGTPKAGGIPPDMSIDRTVETDNSDADFTTGPHTPDPNGTTTLGATTCVGPGPGGGGALLQHLRAKVRRNRVTFTGQIQPPAPGEKVRLTLFANGSPLRKVAKKSDELDAESRFKKRFRVPSESTRCKVKVQFRNQKVGRKRFKC
jgi:hypothetical protein